MSMKFFNKLLVGLALASVLIVPVMSATAQTTDKAKAKKVAAPKPERKVKAGLLSERTYKKLDKIYVQIGEEKYAEAYGHLINLYGKIKRAPYEKAIVAQAIGHVLSAQEKYQEAIKYFTVAIKLDSLPNNAHYPAMLALAQLYAAVNDWNNTIKWVNRWLKEYPVPKDTAYMLLAQANAQLKNYRKAIVAVKKGISLSDDPKESWYQLWMAMHYELKEYPETAKVLEILVSKFTDKREYWSQLSSMYMNMKKDRLALATLALAYRKGLFEKSVDYKQLYGLYGYLQIPYRAAKVLQEGLDKGIVEPNLSNWEQLGNVWYAAQEPKLALKAFAKASVLAEDGKIDMRMAFMYMETDSWDNVISSITKALSKGGVDNPGNANLLLGMAYFEKDKLSEAQKAFKVAKTFGKTKKSAQQWLNHVREELKRRKQDSA